MAKPLQTLAILGVLRTLLFIFNILFWLSGLLLVLFGAWVRFKLHRYLSLDPAGPDSTGAPLVSNRLASSVVPALLTAIGALVLALATAACNCAVKGSAPKLYIYSTLVQVIFLVELTMLLLLYHFSPDIDLAFHDGLSRGLEEYGRDPDATAAIDDIQTTLQCCGVSGFGDWQATPWGRGHGPAKLPHSCCVWTADGVCTEVVTKATLNTQGCYKLVSNFVVTNVVPLALGVSLACALHIVGVVLACALARCIRKAEYEEIR